MPLVIPDIETIERLRKRPSKPKRGKAVKPPVKPQRELEHRMTALWERVLFPATERIKRLVDAGAGPYEIGEAIEQMLRTANAEYAVAANDIVDKWRMSLDRDTRVATTEALKKSMGIDFAVIVDDPAIRDALALGGLEASRLITKMPDEYLGRIAKAVGDNFIGRGLPEGRSLVQQIEHVAGVQPKRAKLIARDQTGKMVSSLNKIRQTSIGISMYIWRTSRDRRVVGDPSGAYPDGGPGHGDHFHMEGLMCRWDDPSVYSEDKGKIWRKRKAGWAKNHPGQDIQCRCHAEPVIDVQKIIALAQES